MGRVTRLDIKGLVGLGIDSIDLEVVNGEVRARGVNIGERDATKDSVITTIKDNSNKDTMYDLLDNINQLVDKSDSGTTDFKLGANKCTNFSCGQGKEQDKDTDKKDIAFDIQEMLGGLLKSLGINTKVEVNEGNYKGTNFKGNVNRENMFVLGDF